MEAISNQQSAISFTTFIWLVVGYLSGSTPTGYWIGKLKGIDLTEIGSGSTGATNVLRNLGMWPALLTLVIDVLKGFLPAYFALKLQSNDLIVVLVGIACLIGHSKSIFLPDFKGGKSSAVGLGILIAISWQAAAITFAIWVVVVGISKYSSLGSIISVPLTPLWIFLFHRPMIYVWLCIIAAIYIVLIRHRENIQRLIKRIEPKI